LKVWNKFIDKVTVKVIVKVGEDEERRDERKMNKAEFSRKCLCDKILIVPALRLRKMNNCDNYLQEIQDQKKGKI